MNQQAPQEFRLPPAKGAGYRQAIKVTWVGIAVTVTQAIVKIVAGVLTRSTALTADGLENVADTGVSLAAIIGLWLAGRPADTRHPYGHGKAEVLTAALIAWLMVMMAMGMAARAIWQIFQMGELSPPSWVAIVFLAGTCVVSETLYRYKMWQANRLMSAVLYAEACDHRKDTTSSLIGLAAVVGAVLLGGRWAVLDPIGGLVTCGFIGWMALRILRQSTPQLMDAAIGGPLLAEIRRLAGEVEGIRGTEKLIARSSGLNVLVELHAEVDPAMSVAEAHRLATLVRQRIVQRIDSITDVLVHVEPYYADDHQFDVPVDQSPT